LVPRKRQPRDSLTGELKKYIKITLIYNNDVNELFNTLRRI